MIAGANIATILIMIAIGYSDRINPAEHPLVANLGMAFPIFLIINLMFLIFWAIFKPTWSLIPIVGYLLCYSPLRTYFPINLPKDVPEGAIKVMSYNVCKFNLKQKGIKDNPIVNYILEQDPDILCLQEFSSDNKDRQEFIDLVDDRYPYRSATYSNAISDYIAIFSKFPIADKEMIMDADSNKVSMAYKLLIQDDTVTVINNHLEITGLTADEVKHFSEIVAGNINEEQAKQDTRKLLDKLGESSRERAPQAEAIAQYLGRNAGKSIICVGDFNDNPISYSHHVIAEKLKDCFVESGFGAGISYYNSRVFVRIDHIFCSDDWQSYGCKVESKIKGSDHYPICCWLKKAPKSAKNE